VTAPPRVDIGALAEADIRADRVRIRGSIASEGELVYAWTRDPDVAPWWGGLGHNPTFGDFLAAWGVWTFDGSAPERNRAFMVEAVDRDEPLSIGAIFTNEVDTDAGAVDIDILIGEGRGEGYGSDALAAFLRFLTRDAGFHRVSLVTYVNNDRARHVYEKLGFIQEGLLRESEWVDGRWVDGVLYGYLAPDKL
jgi:RimJ/RimL family protein N-acetyltransferase